MFEKSQILTVCEFNAAARQVIEAALPLLWVRGEISNFVSAASGHWYFSLKDERAQVRCVMFRHKSQYLDFMPANGAQVEVLALPTLYEARGDFQLVLEKMRPAGLGALFEAFERLKDKLQKEGLFDAGRKRKLPFLPRQIGIVTSPQAAALRDVLRTLANRMPGVPVVLYPTPVQGEGAAQKIATAINTANQHSECDVLIVCRGGGSIEDLWAFNEEVVARAIAGSRIPAVSGVGHETDFTIADFVADLRAATPTAAAQAVVPDSVELKLRLQQSTVRLTGAIMRRHENAMQHLDYLQRRLVHPRQHIHQQRQHLEQLRQRMQRANSHVMRQQQWRWQAFRQRFGVSRPDTGEMQARQVGYAHRLQEGMARNLERYATHLASLQQHLQHLDPAQVLARGYSMVRDEQGRIVVDGAQIAVGARLDVTFAKGWARTEVRETGDGNGKNNQPQINTDEHG